MRALHRSPQHRTSTARPATPGSRDAPVFDAPRTTRDAPRAARAWTSSWSGPEAPLVAGLRRRAAAAAPPSGPIAAAAQLEGSKAFAKEVMVAAGVPTAEYTRRATASRTGIAAITRYPVVLKADGLAAGKGVVIAADEAEARAALEEMLVAAPLRRHAGGRRGVPVGVELSAARAVRRRARAPARPRAGLQAHRRGRHRPEHRRDGRVLAGRRGRRRAGRGRARAGPASRSSTSSRAAGRRSTACSTPG